MARLMTSMSSSNDRMAAASALFAKSRRSFFALEVQPERRDVVPPRKTDAKAELSADDAVEETFGESSDDGELRVHNKSPTRRTLPG